MKRIITDEMIIESYKKHSVDTLEPLPQVSEELLGYNLYAGVVNDATEYYALEARYTQLITPSLKIQSYSRFAQKLADEAVEYEWQVLQSDSQKKIPTDQFARLQSLQATLQSLCNEVE